ncbi:MAG: site-specific DNA-methyltransferase [Candidatus Marinimicrobia bacterium]|nr:site-specific DNA-methyltransferase [Candidatus Neomarinimicrobiota bacterium]
MQNLQNTLIELLKDGTNYTSEGKLLKNKLTEDALKLEPLLLKYLLSNDHLKKHFFIDVDGTLVFDKDKFLQFVNDKEFLPDSYTSFRNKIGLLDEDGKYFSEKRDVVLAWPYKDCVLEGGQDREDQKRNEIFYNEVLAPDEIDRLFDPKVLTNFKRYDKNGEHENPEDLSRDDNLIIKGNNLLALHSLKKLYRGKVKLIYIDPPYNTGTDEFRYNDRFNHSSWLTFIKNRLEVSRELLRDDGVIYISCDDNEQSYLKVLCDSMFGLDNFLGSVCVVSNWKGRSDDKYFATAHNYLLVYKKKSFVSLGVPLPDEYYDDYPEIDENGNYYRVQGLRKRGSGSRREDRPNLYYPIFVKHSTFEVDVERSNDFNIEVYPKLSDGSDGRWRWGMETAKNRLVELVARKVGAENRWDIFQIDYAEIDGKVKRITPKSIWMDKAFSNEAGTLELKKIFGDKVFANPKPTALIKSILMQTTADNDIVLDFFSGSGTTGQAVLELNKEDGGKRKFILVEQMDYVENITIKRVQWSIKQVTGSYTYAELKKWNQNYIDEIEEAKTKKRLLTIYEKMKDEAFFRYDVDLSKFDEDDLSKLELDQQKEVLIECLDKNHLYVNLSEMDDTTYKISDEEKAMNKKFYGLD